MATKKAKAAEPNGEAKGKRGGKRAPENETKEQRFIRLCRQRLVALDAKIRLIGQLGESKSVKWTIEQREQVFTWIGVQIDAASDRWIVRSEKTEDGKPKIELPL